MNKMKNIRKDDEYETPLWAVKIIEPYLTRHSKIWCPFDEDHSNFVTYLKYMGHDVINTHIKYGQDFFEQDPPKGIDYIISNPPYSMKDKIYEKLYQMNIPFAMLVNLQGFADSKKRANIFNAYGVQAIYIYPRVCYIKDGIQTTGNIFQSGYICKDILPKDLIVHVEEK